MNDKADLDASDEGGEPALDVNYPPWGEPLYWVEFKAWASVNIPECSLAVSDEHVADPVTAAALQSYRAGRTATRFATPQGRKGWRTFAPGRQLTCTSGQRTLGAKRLPSERTLPDRCGSPNAVIVQPVPVTRPTAPNVQRWVPSSYN